MYEKPIESETERDPKSGKFVEGNSGPPKGCHSKGKAWASIHKRIGDSNKVSCLFYDKDDHPTRWTIKTEEETNRFAAAMVLWNAALSGDIKAIQIIQEAEDGKPQQKIELEETNEKKQIIKIAGREIEISA